MSNKEVISEQQNESTDQTPLNNEFFLKIVIQRSITFSLFLKAITKILAGTNILFILI